MEWQPPHRFPTAAPYLQLRQVAQTGSSARSAEGKAGPRLCMLAVGHSRICQACRALMRCRSARAERPSAAMPVLCAAAWRCSTAGAPATASGFPPRALHLAAARAVAETSASHPAAAARAPNGAAHGGRPHRGRRAVRGQPVEETYAREEFLAEEGTSFGGLGLRHEVVAALAAAGFPRPASTQVRLAAAQCGGQAGRQLVCLRGAVWRHCWRPMAGLGQQAAQVVSWRTTELSVGQARLAHSPVAPACVSTGKAGARLSALEACSSGTRRSPGCRQLRPGPCWQATTWYWPRRPAAAKRWHTWPPCCPTCSSAAPTTLRQLVPGVTSPASAEAGPPARLCAACMCSCGLHCLATCPML